MNPITRRCKVEAKIREMLMVGRIRETPTDNGRDQNAAVKDGEPRQAIGSHGWIQ